MIYVLHIGLAITAFLVVLNGFLRGAWKHQIDAVLSAVLLGILVTVFVAFGWKAGLVAIVLAFIYGALGRPVAARLAARLMSLGGGLWGTYLGLPTRGLDRTLGVRPLTPRRKWFIVGGFLVVGGLTFYIATCLWDAYFVPSVPMASDWCKKWVDLRDHDNPSAFSGCVEYKNELKAAKAYHNRKMIDRNKWWFFGSMLLSCLAAFMVFRFSLGSSHIGLAVPCGVLAAIVIPRIYSAILPAPYKWFPAAITRAALEREREAALRVGVPEGEVDQLLQSEMGNR